MTGFIDRITGASDNIGGLVGKTDDLRSEIADLRRGAAGRQTERLTGLQDAAADIRGRQLGLTGDAQDLRRQAGDTDFLMQDQGLYSGLAEVARKWG